MRRQGHGRRGQEVLRRRRRSRASRRTPTTRSSSRPPARPRPTSCSASSSTSCRTRSATRSSRARTPSPTPRSPTSTTRTRPASRSPRSVTCASCLTKDKADGRQGPRRAGHRRLVDEGRQAVLDRRHLQGGRRQAARPGQGHAGQGARRRRLLGEEERARGPDQDPVRLLRLHGDRRSPRPASRRWPRPRRRSSRRSQSQNQQKALDTFVKDFTKRWKDKTECSDGYKTSDCKNGPKATPTPTAPATDPTQQVPTDPSQQAPTSERRPRRRRRASSPLDLTFLEAPPPGGASSLTSLWGDGFLRLG